MQKMVLFPCSGKKNGCFTAFLVCYLFLALFFQFLFLYSASLPQNSTSFGKHLPSAWCLGCAQGQHTASYCYKQCRGRTPFQRHHQCVKMVKYILLATLPLQNCPPDMNSLSIAFPRWQCKGNLYKSVCSGIELWATGRSNLSKLAGLLLTTTSNA